MRSTSGRIFLAVSVLLGVFLRFFLADTRPGLNGDEVLFAVEWSSLFSGRISNLLSTPSGRPTELLNLLVGLCTYLISYLTSSLWAVRLPNLLLSTLLIYATWLFSRRISNQPFPTIFTASVSLCPALLALARVSIGAELIPLFSLAQIYLSWTVRPWLFILFCIPSLLYHPTTIFALPFYLILLTRKLDYRAPLTQALKHLASRLPILILVAIIIALSLSTYPPVTRLSADLIHDLKVLLHPFNILSNLDSLRAYFLNNFSLVVILGPMRLLSGLLYFRHIGSVDDSYNSFPVLLATGLLLILPVALAFIYRITYSGLLAKIYSGLALSVCLLAHISGPVGFADHTYRWTSWLIIPILFTTSLAYSEVFAYFKLAALRKAITFWLLMLLSFLSTTFYSHGIAFSRPSVGKSINPIYAPAQRGTTYEQIFVTLTNLYPNRQSHSVHAVTDDYFIYYPLRYYHMHSDPTFLNLSIYRNDLLRSAEGRAARVKLLDITALKKMLDDKKVWITWSHSPVFTELQALSDQYPDKYRSHCAVDLFGQSPICLFVLSD